jgi:hypothetical protein
MGCGRTLAAQLIANYTAGDPALVGASTKEKAVPPNSAQSSGTFPDSLTSSVVPSIDGAAGQKAITTHHVHSSSPGQPILLITDNDLLRNFVLSGGLAGVVTTDVKAVHLEKAGHLGLSKTAHYATFIDFAMLGRYVKGDYTLWSINE